MRLFSFFLFSILAPCLSFGSMKADLTILDAGIPQTVHSESYLVDGEFYLYPLNALYLEHNQTVKMGLNFSFEYDGKIVTPENFKSFNIELIAEELGLVSHKEGSEWPKVVDDHIEIFLQVGAEIGETKLLLAFEDKSGKSLAEFEFLIEVQEEDLLSGGGMTIIKIEAETPTFLKLVDKNGKTTYQRLGFRDTIKVDPTQEYRLFIELEKWGEHNGKQASEIIDFKNQNEAEVDWGWQGKALSLKKVSDNEMFMVFNPKETGKRGKGLSNSLDIITPQIDNNSKTWQKDIVDRYKGSKVNPSYLRLVRNKRSSDKINYLPLIVGQKKKKTAYKDLTPKERRLKLKAMRQFEAKNKNTYQTLNISALQISRVQLYQPQNKPTKSKSKGKIDKSRFQVQKYQGKNNMVLTPNKKSKYKYYTLELLVKEEGRDFDVLKSITFQVKQK